MSKWEKNVEETIKNLKGNAKIKNKKIAIVVSCFNDLITKKLLENSLAVLTEVSFKEKEITIVWVPGAFEIPSAAQRLAQKGFDAVICLGCVIKGATPHFDYVCNATSNGIMQVGLNYKIPVVFGVLTTDNFAQALDRCKKGQDAALAALEMLDLFETIK